MTQQFLGFLLWIDLEQLPNSNAAHCSAWNRLLSFFLAVVVCSLPLVYMLWAWSSFEGYDGWRTRDSKRQKINNATIFAFACMVFLMMTTSYYAVALAYPSFSSLCTFVGPHGHLVWALLHSPPWYLKYPGFVVYVCLVSCGICEYVGLTMWPMRAAVAAGPTFIVPAWFFFGEEFGSLWCFSAGLAAFAIGFEPEIDYHARVRWSISIPT